MPTVTLLAQPYKKAPYVEKKALEAGKYEAKKKGTFGLIHFTEFGIAVWEACMQTDGAARIRLKEAATIEEMEWTVIFKVNELGLRLSCIRYKGKGMGSPKKCFMKLDLNSDDEGDITAFAAKLKENLKRNPLRFTKPAALAAETDMTVDEAREEWERVLGHMIEWKAEPSKKGDDEDEGKKKDKKKKKEKKGGGFGSKLGSLTSSLPIPGSDDKKTGEKKEAEPEVEVLECPECSAEVPMPGPGEALKCPECGLEGEAPERSEPLLFECPGCEGDIEIWTQELPDVLECPHCGASGSLGEEEEEDEKEEEPEEPPAKEEEPKKETSKTKGKPKPKKAPTKAKPKAKKTEELIRPDKGEGENAPIKKSNKGKAHPSFKGLYWHDDYYYVDEKGVKYDRALLKQAQTIVKVAPKDNIRVADCEALFEKVADANLYTDIEKRTMRFIRDNYEFTDNADKKFRHMIGSWASKRGWATRKAKEAEKK